MAQEENIRTRTNALVDKRKESDIPTGSETDQNQINRITNSRDILCGVVFLDRGPGRLPFPKNTIPPRSSEAKAAHPFGSPP